MDTTKKKRVVVPLGLKPELVEQLDAQAAEEGRSRHGQLVRIVEQWFLNTARGGVENEAQAIVPKKKAKGGEAVLKTDVVAADDFRITGVCPECKEKMADWDRQWRCKNCKKIFQK